MTDRAAIIAKVTEIVATVTGIQGLAPDAVLADQEHIDSLDIVEIGILAEEALDAPLGTLEPDPDWTIDKIADAVIAANAPAST